jgi:hypothetical protein
MDIGRKKLAHDLPPIIWPNPEGEVFFITVCCEPRGTNQLATPSAWQALRETAMHRQTSGDWDVSLLLAMPDHWHALCGFHVTMARVIADLKSWLARFHGIRWQRDFFDHRLRSWESAAQKRQYILANPLRAGLIAEGDDWPYVMDRFVVR